MLASSSRLWRLADAGEDTSPFLDGFTPPLCIGPLEASDARALIRQTGLPEATRPVLAEDDIERIRELCGNHPYLIQTLCRRVLDSEGLDEAVEAVRNDRAVTFFFSVDFELLSDCEKAILRHLAATPEATDETVTACLEEPESSIGTSLANLHHLGLVRRDTGRRLVVGNQFLHWWLADAPNSP